MPGRGRTAGSSVLAAWAQTQDLEAAGVRGTGRRVGEEPGASDGDPGPGVRRLGQYFLLSSHPRVWFPHLHRRGVWSLSSVRNFLDAHTRHEFSPHAGWPLDRTIESSGFPTVQNVELGSPGPATTLGLCYLVAQLGYLAVAQPCLLGQEKSTQLGSHYGEGLNL